MAYTITADYNPLQEPYKLLKDLLQWISNRKWYPRELGKPRISWASSHQRLVLAVIEAGDEKLYVPVWVDSKPPVLPVDYVVVNAGGRTYYAYEAEYNPEYLERIKNLREVEVQGEIPRMENNPYIIPTISTSILLRLKSNNKNYLFKSYRVINKYNPEPLLLKSLTISGFNKAPRLYAALYMSRESSYIGVIEEYFGRGVEVGSIFYRDLKKYLGGKPSEIQGLAEQVGVSVAEMHKAIVRSGLSEVVPEIIDKSDIAKWRNRIISRYEYLNSNLKEQLPRRLLSSLDENGIGSALGLLDEFLGKKKMLIHQNLHLGQLLSIQGRRLVILDFNGEPGRPPEERMSKEPPARDLACILRSLHYIGFVGLREAAGLSSEKLAEKLLAEDSLGGLVDKTAEWICMAITTIIYSYSESMRKYREEVHGVSKGFTQWLIRAVEPWVVERALYEATYELRYRRGMLYVPLAPLYPGLTLKYCEVLRTPPP